MQLHPQSEAPAPAPAAIAARPDAGRVVAQVSAPTTRSSQGAFVAMHDWVERLPRWSFLSRLPRFRLGGGRGITALMVGKQCALVRVEARGDGLHLMAAEICEPHELARFKSLFRRGRGLLVLRSEERFLLTLDKPEVPDAELNLAVRWPMGEALSAEPEQLLTTALALPRLNEAVKPQVLAIAARLDAVQAQLASLRKVGIDIRSIDVVDSALRGMALLQPEVPTSTVAVALVGTNMSIGLIQQGQLCALRSVPLPDRVGETDALLAEQLALNARRTFDHYERQAMLSQRNVDGAQPVLVGRALASVASLSKDGLETFCSALPEAPQLFDLQGMLKGTAELHARCQGHDELTALACVAATRLFDAGSGVARPSALVEAAAS